MMRGTRLEHVTEHRLRRRDTAKHKSSRLHPDATRTHGYHTHDRQQRGCHDQCADRVTELTGSVTLADKLRHSWGAMLKPAAFRGHLCFGPNLGQQVRFTRPDRWLAQWQPMDAAAARAELTRRYLTVYGPVPEKQFGLWLGVSPAEARRVLTGLGDEVTSVQIDGQRRWLLARHLAEMRDATPSNVVRLLPGFDQYVVGASWHAEQLLPAADLRIRVYRPQGWISPVLLVNGRMEGTWRHEIKGSRVEVVIEPFAMVPVWARRAAGQEAERLAAFLGGALSLEWRGDRPHAVSKTR